MQTTQLPTTRLGRTGLEITRVGFGAWAIGGGGWEFGWGPQDDERVDRGDPARARARHQLDRHRRRLRLRPLGGGRRPRARGRRERAVRVHQVLAARGAGPQVVHSLERDSIRREAEASLARLGVDAIDLYQIHWPEPRSRTSSRAGRRWRSSRTRASYDTSACPTSTSSRCAGSRQIAPIETLQPQYSLIEREVEAEILPYAEREGIGVIVYSPMASGLLTGAMTRERIAAMPDDDWRKRDDALQRAAAARPSRDGRARSRRVGERLGVAPGAVAIAWTLRNPAVDGAIVGLRRPDQVDADLIAAAARGVRTGHRRDRGGQVADDATTGFAGLAAIGGPVAGRLLDTGHAVNGWNRTAERATPLVERGLVLRDSPRSVARASDVVISMVTDDDALRTVTAGPDGILAGLSPGQLYADMSTVDPETSRALAASVHALDAHMLDAPVSGSAPAAEQGSLAIMVGGSGAAFELAEPLLRSLGSTITHVGGNGQGLVMKLAVNISLAAQMVAFSEGVLLAERGGIDPALAVSVLAGSAIGSPMLKARAPLVLAEHGPAWFPVDLMQKDLRLAQSAASRLHAPLPTGVAADHVMTAARLAGHGSDDITSVFATLASPAMQDVA